MHRKSNQLGEFLACYWVETGTDRILSLPVHIFFTFLLVRAEAEAKGVTSGPRSITAPLALIVSNVNSY
jgi:hypothetical protein